MQEHIKKQILIRPDTHYRGYQQLGANVTRYEEGYQRDWHEAIDLYREQSPQVMEPHAKTRCTLCEEHDGWRQAEQLKLASMPSDSS